MTSFVSLSKAMALGFVRDKTATFFTILFPLMFLSVFGALFKDSGVSKTDVLQVGSVAVLDQIPADARGDLEQVLKITKTDDLAAALEKVRAGDSAAAVEQQGGKVIVHFSAADQVKAATVRGIMESIVQQGNLTMAGVTTPALTLSAEPVEDKSMKAIQYMTPGLLGWAIASGATFGAALTLVSWRQKKILRRLRLSPVSVGSIVTARVGVSIGIALLQSAIFIGVALLPAFGLQLSSYWWAFIPIMVAGTLAFLSIGLLAGAVSKTPEAASAIANLIVLPMAFLSGSFFPLDNAPGWLRTLSNFLPLKHLVTSMQDVMVRGQSPTATLPAIGILLGFTVVVTGAAAMLFKWDDV
ncbi:MAG: ABC transporter permease [Hamadaea sp.]|uniref:ABC transporter permease n=1 Tax=Hamadaea sp. TaxID=2024425 RepID=UPI00179728B3|nr:ABC transporter permease [Hamadaea sp.]NUR71239.1 ABC transporter permease [Hamadaea sp.]NUT19640.1 ABC transporter permease [Hamadaea sp.]